AAEGVDIWAGYQIINVAYQGIPLYLTARIIGGYTKYAEGRIIFDEAVGDQWVTKWDTGRMEISGAYVENAVPVTELVGALYSTVSIRTGPSFESGFSSEPTVVATINVKPVNIFSVQLSYQSTTGFSYRPFAVATVTDQVIFKWQAVGRWK
ncbi:MAG: hypothetical protein DRI69_09035, partial [Bacteroidetes bacterium]